MLIAGFVAACAILLGPTVSHHSNEWTSKKAKSEESSPSQQGPVIQAPSEAIPGTAVKLDEPSTPLITLIKEEAPRITYPVIRSEQVIRYFKILFRTIIASNAP